MNIIKEFAFKKAYDDLPLETKIEFHKFVAEKTRSSLNTMHVLALILALAFAIISIKH